MACIRKSSVLFIHLDFLLVLFTSKLMGSKTTCALAQTPIQKLGLREDKEAGPIKDIKELGPPHMPKH